MTTTKFQKYQQNLLNFNFFGPLLWGKFQMTSDLMKEFKYEVVQEVT